MAEAPKLAHVGAIECESGKTIPSVDIAYQTFGEFSGDNAVLICHALTGTSNVVGWWDRIVGPGKPIDTNKYFVIGNNLLGGCQGSTGPSSQAEDGKPWGARFPVITIRDQMQAQHALLEHIGITSLHAVVGCSTGGFHALQWAKEYPGFARKVILSASGPRQNALQLALNEAGRQAIMRDPKWRGGNYDPDNPPRDGLAVARMIGHIAYLSGEALERKFGRSLQERDAFAFTLSPEFAVESYLNYQGDKFNDRFDANSYLYLTRAANYFDIHSLSGAESDFLFISFDSDTLYPPKMSEELAQMASDAGRRGIAVTVSAPFGHDSFLLDSAGQGALIAEFLAPV